MERNFNVDRRFQIFCDKLTSNNVSKDLIIESSYNTIDFSSNTIIFDGQVDLSKVTCNNINISNISEIGTKFLKVNSITLPSNVRISYNSVNDGYIINTSVGYNSLDGTIGRSDAYFTYINVSGGDSSFNNSLYINKNLIVDGIVTISNNLLINGANFASIEPSFNNYKAALEQNFYSAKITTKDVSALNISISNELVMHKTTFINNLTISGQLLNSVLKVPNIFTIDPSGHDNHSGTLIIAGDLTVRGAETTLSSTNIDICDVAIKLASNLVNILDLSNANAGLDISNIASLKYNGTVWNFSGGQLTIDNKKVLFTDDVSLAKRNFDLSINALIADFSSSFFTYKRNIDDTYNDTYTRFQIDNSFILKSNFDLSLTALKSYADSSYISKNQFATSYGDIITLIDKSYEAKNNRVDGALCVAVGYGINKIAYSYNGIDWIPVVNSSNIFAYAGLAVAWNGIRWVAVGTGNNAIAYSPNGIDWTAVPTSITIGDLVYDMTVFDFGNGIAWNGTLWVAVGQGDNSIAYSSDGITWSGSSYSYNIFTVGRGIVWNGTIWVAVGEGPIYTIAYSYNGINWDGVPGSKNILYQALGIAWNGTMLVAVGSGTNNIAYSSDGITWIPVVNSTTIFSVAAFGVAWNGTMWVAVGRENNSIAYSYNGIYWEVVPNSRTIFSTYGYGITWNGSRWIAVGGGTNSIAYSYDGINWSGAVNSRTIFSIEGYGVAWNGIINSFYVSFNSFNSKLDISYVLKSVFEASHNSLKTRFDISFATINATNINASSITIDTINTKHSSQRFANTLWNQIGLDISNIGTFGVANKNNKIVISNDGKVAAYSKPYTAFTTAQVETAVSTWSYRTVPDATNLCRGICWSPELGLFVAVGDSGNNRVMTSPNGITWTSRIATSASRWYSVCWSKELGIFVAVSRDIQVMTSSNGITWISRTPASGAGRSVCWSPELILFVAVSDNAVARSSDGITWIASSGIPQGEWVCVCWSPERRLFVAGSVNFARIMTSSDGITWTAGTSPAATSGQWTSVCWSPQLLLFVAVGFAGTYIMTSPDGIVWTGKTGPVYQGWFSVCWSKELGIFVAVAITGSNNRVMTSRDGTTWTGRTAGGTDWWYGVCWSGELGIFAAVGSGGTNIVMTSSVASTTYNGIVYVYELSNNNWNQLGTNAILGISGDELGYSLALSSNGRIVAASSLYNNASSGQVRLFELSNNTNTWIQKGFNINGPRPASESGYSISLSGNGNSIAIGAWKDNSNGTNAGAVRVYDFSASIADWRQRGQTIVGISGSFEGYVTALSLDGQTLASGSILEASRNVIGSGGTITINKIDTASSYIIHSFTTVGTTPFILSAPVTVEYLVVAGGGSGGVGSGGGGGAGGVRIGTTTLTAGSYNITVGAGGTSVINDAPGNNGGSSSISTLIVATGGGGGGGWSANIGKNGGSGGGAGARDTSIAGTGVTGQGFAGSARLNTATGGGGGGAGAAALGKDGAIGITSTLTGTTKYYAGGGGAGSAGNIGLADGGIYQLANGTYGGGNGASTSGTKQPFQDGVANTGGGGGGQEGYAGNSGAGGSGIVIIRYLHSDNTTGPVKTFTWSGTSWINKGTIEGPQIYLTDISYDISNTFIPSQGQILGGPFTLSGTTYSNTDYNGYGSALNSDGTIFAISSASSPALGCVRVYKYNGTSWQLMGPIIYGTATNNIIVWYSYILNTLQLSYDGRTIATLVSGSTATFGIYRYNDVSWNNTGYLSNGRATTHGPGVLSGDGNTFVMSDETAGSGGIVYAWKYINNVWTTIAAINNTFSPTFSYWAMSLGISYDGNTLVGSTRVYPSNADQQGYARVFKYNGTIWNQLGPVILGPRPTQEFGWAASMSSDGLTISVGGYTDFRVFKYNAIDVSWQQIGVFPVTSGSVAYSYLSGDGTIVATWYSNKAFIWKYRLGSWVKIVESSDGTGWNGNALSADGTVYATCHTSPTYIKIHKLTTTISNIINENLLYSTNKAKYLNLFFGRDIKLSSNGNKIVIGATGPTINSLDLTFNTNYPYNQGYRYNQGSIYVYEYIGTTWRQLGQTIHGISGDDEFGSSISMSNDGTIISAGSNNNVTNSGYVMVFAYANNYWYQVSNAINGKPTTSRVGTHALSGDGTTLIQSNNTYNNAYGINKNLAFVPSTTIINTTISGDIVVTGKAMLKSFRISDKHIFDVSINGYSSHYLASSDISASIVDYYSNVGSIYNRVFRIDACGNVSNYSGLYGAISDSRLKENIVTSSPKLEDLLKVRVVNYNLKGQDSTKYIGVLAQELEELFPELVVETNTDERFKSVNYSSLTILLIKAFQEQQVLINNLNATLEKLEK